MDTLRRPGKPWKCPLNSALPIARGHVTVYRYVFLLIKLPVTAPSPATQSKNAASQTSEHGAVIRK